VKFKAQYQENKEGQTMNALTRIGNCFSGLLIGPHSPYRRIALATPRALRKFERSHPLQQAVEKIGQPGNLLQPSLDQAAIDHEIFVGWKGNLSLGLRLREPASDETVYQRARELMRSMARGEHRLAYLMKNGVEADPQIQDLSPHLYAAMLAKIRDVHGSPDFNNIAFIGITSERLGSITERREGVKLVFSLPLLEEYPDWAHLEEV
jgi:hypothetical protein